MAWKGNRGSTVHEAPWLRLPDPEELLAALRSLTGEAPAAATALPCVRPGCGPRFQAVKVQTTDGRECFALLDRAAAVSGIRLIATVSLLGHKARVAVLCSDGGEVVWDVRVVWAVRLLEGLFENGAFLLEPSTNRP